MFHFFTKVESISTAELEKRLKTNIKLLDVRTPSEYNRGHIKGALNIPLGQIDRYSQSKEEKLYVICHSGVRSRLAAKKLKKKGYDVVNVSGGMMSWKGDVVESKSIKNSLPILNEWQREGVAYLTVVGMISLVFPE